MTLYNVTVSNISSNTTEAQLNDFFVLCGKIASIEYSEKDHTATVAFENPKAAETALMLNGTDLHDATLSITSDTVHQGEEGAETQEDSYEQSDKPRAGNLYVFFFIKKSVAAEYLAKGYILSDRILERAIEMDNKQGISKRFLSYFQSLDKSVGERTLGPDQTITGKLQSTVDKATQQARSVDEEKGYFKILHDYYVKAISSSLGQKVRSFYTDTSKQVRDIHEEARRIVEHEKSEKSSTKQTQEASAAEQKCTPVN